MGQPRKRSNNTGNRVSKASGSSNPDGRAGVKGSFQRRDKATVNRLSMYKSGGKVVRDKNGQVLRAAPFQSKVASGTVARVEPNRRWFGNTRVIGQKDLEAFRESMTTAKNDPYQLVMHQKKLPMSLLHDPVSTSRVHVLDTQPFETTFGKKAQRKRPNLAASDVSELAKSVEEKHEQYDVTKDRDLVLEDEGWREEAREPIFQKGQSKRIWNELYKVIDASDVIIQVLDARDPLGTRSPHIEEYMRKEKAHKNLIFVLNKCDLVPTWVTARWVATLSQDVPTLAFHASVKNPFGKKALIQLLRQFGKLHDDKKQISIGFIGYPNVGKSSIINTLKAEKVCKVAPIPGETKVWQYITLFRRVYLIDCPGVVYPSGDSESDVVLKGVVRVEQLKYPCDYIGEILQRVKPEYITKTYRLGKWSRDKPTEFLEAVAVKSGKLLKGGEPDIYTVAKMVLHDWQRGRIPYFVPPPAPTGDKKPAESKFRAPQQSIKDIRVVAAFDRDDMLHKEGDSGDVADTPVAEQEGDDVEHDAEDDEPGMLELSWEDLQADQSAEAEGAGETGGDESAEKESDAQPMDGVASGEEPAEPTASKASKAAAKAAAKASSDGWTVVAPAAKKRQRATRHDEEDVDEGPVETKRKRGRIIAATVKEPRRTSNKTRAGKHFYSGTDVKNRRQRR
eukprot:m.93888 g.93888  ORF g.93888 m.93888 type:complete len:677 (-) comp15106_c0_seq3:57-2087(-)